MLLVRLILNLTPTGMVPTKAMTPVVPLSVEEIVQDVRICHEKHGITMLHLHARDADGFPTHRAEIYAKLIDGIRNYAPDLVICTSLSGRTVSNVELRADPILKLKDSLKPDMGSLTLSSMNFTKQENINSPETVQRLAQIMLDNGIVPELEIFDLGMANYARYLVSKGLVKPPFYANLFLGNIAGAQLDLAHAGIMLRDLPEGTLWSFGGIGDAQLGANLLAIAMGGGVRIGLEDNIYVDRERKVLATNEAFVGRIHRLATESGREVMTPSELRSLLKLKPGNGSYGR